MNTNYSNYRRQSFRLQGYDYRREGMYFVTICTKDRLNYFGKIEDGKLVSSEIGQIVLDNWLKIPQFSPHIVLDEFVVMPNHVHGILAIVQPVDDHVVASLPVVPVGSLPVASLQCNDATTDNDATTSPPSPSPPPPPSSSPKNQFMASISPKSGSISRVLNSYKGACSKEIRLKHDAGFDWQSKFHDRIIRNDEELHRIQRYIIQNPLNWKDDENNIH